MVSSATVSVISPVVDISCNIRVELKDPNKFFARMVQCKLGLDSRVGIRLGTSELELFDEVFMLNLGELSSFVRIKVNIVHIQGCIGDGGSARGGGVTSGGNVTLGSWAEANVKFNFVILERNQRERKTGISATLLA